MPKADTSSQERENASTVAMRDTNLSGKVTQGDEILAKILDVLKE